MQFAYIPETRLWDRTAIITLGERLVNGSGPSLFYDPTDVAIEPDTEDFYVSDGYGNKRVVKFDRCGNYLFEFSAGTIDSTIPIVPFHIVHKVTVAIRHTPTTNRALRRSSNNKDVVVAVADRNNYRIQYFSVNGTFLYELTHEHLGIPQTWLMSVAHVDVNPRDAPYNVNFDAEFGFVYVSDFGSATVPPRVHEVAIGWSNASVISSFSINASYPFVRRGSAHDLTVSKNGREVYVVSPNSNTLIVKRFQMKIESSANRNFYVSGMIMFVMAYLSTTVQHGRT